MDFLEKDLEDIIWDNLFDAKSLSALYSKGLDIFYKNGMSGEIIIPHMTFRQKRIGNYGVPDIITLTKCNNEIAESSFDLYHQENFLDINIIELKNITINYETLIQGFRYKKGIERFLYKKKPNTVNYRINVILIGRRVEINHDWIYLLEEIRDLRIYTYRYNIDGIFFEEEEKGYYLSSEGF